MAEKKKSTKKITVNDVAPVGKVAPETSAKSVIVTNRPIIKDPMAVETAEPEAEKPVVELKGKTLKPVLKSELEAPNPEKAEELPTPLETPAENPSDAAPDDAEKPPADDGAAKPSPAEAEEADLAKQAEHDKAVQKLIDEEKYFLPINAVEKRRSRRFVLVGILLSLVLVIAWADVALDAGLIKIGNVKPVTHFFSN